MKPSKSRGFTLIELMVAVAIVGILAAVAVPSYTKYVARGKRSAAQSVMQTAGSRQEQFMLNARSYATTLADLRVTPSADVTDSYTITVTANNAAAPPTWTITATPTAAQANRDSECGTLTLVSTGVKTASGPGAKCW